MDVSRMAARCRELRTRAAEADLSRQEAETAGLLLAEASAIEKQLKAAGYDLHSLVVL